MPEPVTIAVLGAGSRGRTLAGYAEEHPDEVRVVAVADPVAQRRDALADRHGVPAGRRYPDWRDLAGGPRLADAVLVATPDREHAGPGRRFAELGYDVLLEKPIAPTEAECVGLVEAIRATGVGRGVCHGRRYTPYRRRPWWRPWRWRLRGDGRLRRGRGHPRPRVDQLGSARVAGDPPDGVRRGAQPAQRQARGGTGLSGSGAGHRP